MTDTGGMLHVEHRHGQCDDSRLAAHRAPLVQAIVQALAATDDHTLREGFFLDLLRRGFSATEARNQLETAIDWGRYAELYDYDRDDGEFTLEPGARANW
jgi:NitT/TauT family transport system ATP-binding protein